MTEYRHSGHAVFDLKYHMIWCTKYCYKILRGRVWMQITHLFIADLLWIALVLVAAEVCPR